LIKNFGIVGFPFIDFDNSVSGKNAADFFPIFVSVERETISHPKPESQLSSPQFFGVFRTYSKSLPKFLFKLFVPANSLPILARDSSQMESASPAFILRQTNNSS
jgi:hypothetical protein